MIAVVAEGNQRRLYFAPDEEQQSAAIVDMPDDVIDSLLPSQALGFRVQAYGLRQHKDLFGNRPLVAIDTMSSLIPDVRKDLLVQLCASRELNEKLGSNIEQFASDYADAVTTYLACSISRMVDSMSTLTRWQSTGDKVASTFSRQALTMTWDYAEVNPFSRSTRNFLDGVEWVAEVLDNIVAGPDGTAVSADARLLDRTSFKGIISTDPPYYDNIGYADLSDFFYFWLRPILQNVFPETFRTLLTPKDLELIAATYRHQGSREKAKIYFEEGLERVMDFRLTGR